MRFENSTLYYVKLITGDNIFSYIEESEDDPMEVVFIQPAFMHLLTTEIEDEKTKEKDTKIEYIMLGWLPTGKTDVDRVEILRQHILYAAPMSIEYTDTILPLIEKIYAKSKPESMGEIYAMLEKFKKKNRDGDA